MLADRYGLSLSTSSQPRRPELWREVRDFAGKSFPKARVAFADVHRAVACARRIARRATVNVAGFSAEPTLQ
jgi:hypothetical protein